MVPIIPFVILLCNLIKSIINLRLIIQDHFSIVKDTVHRMAKGEIPRNASEGRHLVDAIYFEKHGRYTTRGSIFEISSIGDEFYLVILHSKQKKIVLAFPSIMYDCKEIDINS